MNKQQTERKDILIAFLLMIAIGSLIYIGISSWSNYQTSKELEYNQTINNATIKGYNLGIYDVLISNSRALSNQINLSYFVMMPDGNLSIQSKSMKDICR